MSATKSYYERISEKLGFGGEISESFLEKFGSGELKNSIQITDRRTGDTAYCSVGDAKRWKEELFWAAETWDCEVGEAEMRLRRGDVCDCGHYVRIMLIR